MPKTRARAMLLAIVTTSCALVLSGCGHKALAVAVRPPAELLTCDGEPLPPSLPDRDQQDARDALMLDYALALRSAWGSCAGNLAGVKAWSDALP